VRFRVQHGRPGRTGGMAPAGWHVPPQISLRSGPSLAGAMFFTGESAAADTSETGFLEVYGAHLPSGGGTQTLLFPLVDATQARRQRSKLE
jgi:hypothetical protein